MPGRSPGDARLHENHAVHRLRPPRRRGPSCSLVWTADAQVSRSAAAFAKSCFMTSTLTVPTLAVIWDVTFFQTVLLRALARNS